MHNIRHLIQSWLEFRETGTSVTVRCPHTFDPPPPGGIARACLLDVIISSYYCSAVLKAFLPNNNVVISFSNKISLINTETIIVSNIHPSSVQLSEWNFQLLLLLFLLLIIAVLDWNLTWNVYDATQQQIPALPESFCKTQRISISVAQTNFLLTQANERRGICPIGALNGVSLANRMRQRRELRVVRLRKRRQRRGPKRPRFATSKTRYFAGDRTTRTRLNQ